VRGLREANDYGIDYFMKQYVIDEIRPRDHEKIKEYLDAHYGPAEMGDLYWIPVDADLYDPLQAAHRECLPLFFALQLQPASLAVELLVRTKNRVRCDCIQYATDDQFRWLIRLIDAILEKLGVIS
jgi:hypothetical protein